MRRLPHILLCLWALAIRSMRSTLQITETLFQEQLQYTVSKKAQSRVQL